MNVFHFFLQEYCHFKNPMTTLDELDMKNSRFEVDIGALVFIFLILRIAAFIFLRWKLMSVRWRTTQFLLISHFSVFIKRNHIMTSSVGISWKICRYLLFSIKQHRNYICYILCTQEIFSRLFFLMGFCRVLKIVEIHLVRAKFNPWKTFVLLNALLWFIVCEFSYTHLHNVKDILTFCVSILLNRFFTLFSLVACLSLSFWCT